MHLFFEHCTLDWQDKHCYSRLLELLINVWAYHSARRMVYIDPGTCTNSTKAGYPKRADVDQVVRVQPSQDHGRGLGRGVRH